MTLLIGFGNKARQGKDAAATAVLNEYAERNRILRLNYGRAAAQLEFNVFKYATALYEEVNEWLYINPLWAKNGISNDFPEWVQPDPKPEVSHLAPYGKHPKLLQWWGTEYRRAQDVNYWVKKLIQSIPESMDFALVTDVRFPNEAEAIERRKGATINVQRLNEDGSVFVDPSRPADHPSETALDGWNWGYYIKSKSAEITGVQAIAIVDYLRGRS